MKQASASVVNISKKFVTIIIDYIRQTHKKDFEILLMYDNSDFIKLSEIVDDFVKKGYRVRAEDFNNINSENIESFNFDQKYLFKNGELILDIL